MARRHQSSRFREVHRRATFWGRSPADTGVTVLAAATAVLDSSSVPITQGQTIVRTRGTISVKSDQTTAPENIVGAVGFAVVSDEAFTAGVASIPTPYTDSDSELWFMHQFFTYGYEFVQIDATGVQINTDVFGNWSFDSKAMRKMESGQTLVIVVENGSASSGMHYFLNYSVLFKVA